MAPGPSNRDVDQLQTVNNACELVRQRDSVSVGIDVHVCPTDSSYIIKPLISLFESESEVNIRAYIKMIRGVLSLLTPRPLYTTTTKKVVLKGCPHKLWQPWSHPGL